MNLDEGYYTTIFDVKESIVSWLFKKLFEFENSQSHKMFLKLLINSTKNTFAQKPEQLLRRTIFPS